MKSSRAQAFTLIEMLTVMLIIAVIAGLIIQVAGYAQKKSALTQARGEIESMGVSLNSYKVDYGNVPRMEGVTEAQDAAQAGSSPIDPKKTGNPQTSVYKAANMFLYQQLSGDQNNDGNGGDTVEGKSLPNYGNFNAKQLSIKTSNKQVEYIRDPFGNPYGYSTAGLLAEEAYRVKAREKKASTNANDEGVTREEQPGYNNTYDLWSTAGETVATPSDLTRAKWIKNW